MHRDGPIVVAQMGKVGSTSVARALEPIDTPVFHVHHLDKDLLDLVAKDLKDNSLPDEHIAESYRVLEEIVKPGLPASIVSLVRDPIARNISAFFQNKQLMSGSISDIDQLIAKFLDVYPHDVPLEYFDLQIHSVFGVDIYDTEFDHEKRRLVASNDTYSLLVLRAEDEDKHKQAALREFFGDDSLVVKRANIAANKRKIMIKGRTYSEVYSEFIDRLELPESYITRMLDSKFAKHFYTQDELEAFAKKWSRPASSVSTASPTSNLPTIGIVSPSYNQAQFVGRMLDSVEMQSYPPAEHIILDGVSSDGTGKILEEFAKKHDWADLTIAKDNGQVDAINQGFSRSTADIVTWLNTDDIYRNPDVLRSVAEEFDKNPDVDIVYARGRFVDPEGGVLREVFINSKPEDLEREFTHSVGILQPALFFRRDVFGRFGPLDEELSCAFDYEYWIRLARGGAKFHFVDKVIVDATLHENSKTQGQRATQYAHTLESVKRHYGFVPRRWLRRVAEHEVCGIDGIVQNKDDVPADQTAKINAAVDELHAKWNGSLDAYRRLLSRPTTGNGSFPIAETIEDLQRRSPVNTDKTIVTSFTSAYYQQGLNLIASLHRLEEGAFSQIIVYDIDFTPAQREALCDLDRVAVRDYPAETKGFFEGYMSPKNYAYKCAAIKAAGDLVRDGDRVLWIDAGVAVVHSLDEIFDSIAAEGAFFVDHDDKGNWPIRNSGFTHPDAARRMNVTGRELLSPHICSCLLGYQKNGPAQRLIEDAYIYSQDPEIVAWIKHPEAGDALPMGEMPAPRRKAYHEIVEKFTKGGKVKAEDVLGLTPYFGHRQDQSIYSILCARYKIKQSSATRFCWSDNESSSASYANWKSGGEAVLDRSRELPDSMPLPAITYHHRGLYDNLDGMRIAAKSETLVLLGNGPSLKGFDFAKLEGADTLGMNVAYRHWDRINWYPTYYACMDKVVIMSHADEILRLIRERKTNGIRRFFLREILAEAHPEIRECSAVVLLEDVQKSYSALGVKDITTGNFSALFGATMGYKKILLLGIDCNYVEQIKEAVPAGATRLEMTSTPTSNPNYFFDDYQQSGDLYNIPNGTPGFHAGSWTPTQEVLADLSVNVVNCNLKSELKVFPFGDIRDEIKSGAKPKPVPDTTIGAEYSRDARASIDELMMVRDAIGTSHIDDLMIDVGAHHGGSTDIFLRQGWNVLAFEPDPVNRARSVKRHSKNKRFRLDPRALGNQVKKGVPFYTSDQSSGASSLAAFTAVHKETETVDVTTLTIALKEHKVESVRLLKIDAEGFDKHVLEGFPWDKMKPAVIMCEFEDRKTLDLGYSTGDMAGFLVSQGYHVVVSEWHPIIRYGVQHDWRRLFRFGAKTVDSQSWGNLIAFRYETDAAAFEDVVRTAIREGSLTNKDLVQADPPVVSAPQKTPTGTASKPAAPAPQMPRRKASKPRPVLPATKLVTGNLPWAPRELVDDSSEARLRLAVGKLGRVYSGRAGILAGGVVLCWVAGVIALAFGGPAWLGMLMGTLSLVPLFALIGLVAVTARRQSFENDEAMRDAVEAAIRKAASHIQSNR